MVPLCGIFPIDEETVNYLRITGRDENHIEIIEKYSKEQLIWRDKSEEINYNQKINIDLDLIEPCVSGPKRPQDRVNLQNLSKEFTNSLEEHEKGNEQASNKLKHGDVCLAAITSCTNTSNPSVLIMAGLIAKKL